MTTVHRRVGHQIAEIHFPNIRFVAKDCALTCSCGAEMDASTPKLLEEAWQAHRLDVRAGEARPLGKVPGYTFGGAFK